MAAVDVMDGRLENLRKANRARTDKARLKIALAKMSGPEACLAIAKQLEDDWSVLGVFSVQELLLCVNGVGKAKAKTLARFADRTPLGKKVRELTDPRRHELARVLRERADGLV